MNYALKTTAILSFKNSPIEEQAVYIRNNLSNVEIPPYAIKFQSFGIVLKASSLYRMYFFLTVLCRGYLSCIVTMIAMFTESSSCNSI